MKRLIIKTIILSIAIPFAAVFCVCIAPTVAMALSDLFDNFSFEKMASPKIEYAEFPFQIQYEMNGELYTVKDTVICEYQGVVRTDEGMRRKWKNTLRESGEEDLLLVDDGDTKVYCDVGDAEYYMDDMMYGLSEFKPKIYLFEEKVSSSEQRIRKLNSYNIKLVSWEFSAPIDNNFSFFN